MKPYHLSEEDIQQYALDERGCSVSTINHINTCETCKAKADVYRLLFAEIQLQPKPMFEFDIAQLVLPQLPQAKPAFTWSAIGMYMVTAIITVVIVAPLYFFSKYFINILNVMPSVFVYAIAAATIIIVAYKVFDMYKKYQKQISNLNFY